MPSRRSRSSGQRRAQGGGRTPNSEPRIQVFKEFAGINFDMANWSAGVDVDTAHSVNGDQTDLQMNYLLLQNNVSVASNKTLETRDDLVKLFVPEIGSSFTGSACMVNDFLYIADTDGIGVGSVSEALENDEVVPIDSHVTDSNHGTWTSLSLHGDKFIALNESNEIWLGDYVVPYLPDMWPVGLVEKPVEVPNPSSALGLPNLTPRGNLHIGTSESNDYPFRVTIAYTYVNEFGPTLPSPSFTFYANTAVSEWGPAAYLVIGPVGLPSGVDNIDAVELYYATDNAMDMLFLGRTDLPAGSTTWSHTWYGYVDATSMWPVANLLVPTENYTKGVAASRMTMIDGRMYFYGCNEEPQRLYIGGNPGNLLSVSPGTGGGFVDVEPGAGYSVRHVCKYKTQSGNSIVTMLCDSEHSKREQRYNLVENSVSISNEQTMKSWQAEQVAGAVGCKSYDGAVVCADGLYSVSRYGLALTTMTMEYNAQIRTNYVSEQIGCVFTERDNLRLKDAKLLELDGVIYMAFADQLGSDSLGSVLFCYDIDLKAWWTYTIDEPIINLVHIDCSGMREGVGIITPQGVYLLPTTEPDDASTVPDHTFLLRTAQLSTQMPQQGWHYLSQLEFHFDRFVGSATITVEMVDMFGRSLTVRKVVEEDEVVYDHVVHMRIDQRVMSYVITMEGTARFRLTHWLARVYTMSNKVGQVWGFDDSISHRSAGSVHPTFKSYNDVRRAIFT